MHLNSRPPTPAPVPTGLDMTKLRHEEILLVLSLLGHVRLAPGSTASELLKKLEQHFTDDDFDEAFNKFKFAASHNGQIMHGVDELIAI